MTEGQGYRARIFRSYIDTCAKELGLHAGLDASAYYPVFEAHYLPLLPAERESRILEIGCGMGFLLKFLKERGYRNCSGIDVSPRMAELARGSGASVEEADALKHLEGRTAQYDCILAIDVLEHLTKDELLGLMDAVLKALKPGGCFVAHTVNADGLSWGRMRHIDLTHELAFTRYSLSQLFTVAGFARSEFRAVEPVGWGPRALLRKAIWSAVKFAAGLIYHAEMGSGILNNDHILTSSILAKAVKAA